MSITAAASALILASTIAATIDDIDVISVSKIAGESFRKAYQSKEVISATERKYTFYLTEAEANVTITKLSLYGSTGCTTTLGTGTEMCNQVVNIVKTSTQSLLIYWSVKVV